MKQKKKKRKKLQLNGSPRKNSAKKSFKLFSRCERISDNKKTFSCCLSLSLSLYAFLSLSLSFFCLLLSLAVTQTHTHTLAHTHTRTHSIFLYPRLWLVAQCMTSFQMRILYPKGKWRHLILSLSFFHSLTLANANAITNTPTHPLSPLFSCVTGHCGQM